MGFVLYFYSRYTLLLPSFYNFVPLLHRHPLSTEGMQQKQGEPALQEQLAEKLPVLLQCLSYFLTLRILSRINKAEGS